MMHDLVICFYDTDTLFATIPCRVGLDIRKAVKNAIFAVDTLYTVVAGVDRIEIREYDVPVAVWHNTNGYLERIV